MSGSFAVASQVFSLFASFCSLSSSAVASCVFTSSFTWSLLLPPSVPSCAGFWGMSLAGVAGSGAMSLASLAAPAAAGPAVPAAWHPLFSTLLLVSESVRNCLQDLGRNSCCYVMWDHSKPFSCRAEHPLTSLELILPVEAALNSCRCVCLKALQVLQAGLYFLQQSFTLHFVLKLL